METKVVRGRKPKKTEDANKSIDIALENITETETKDDLCIKDDKVEIDVEENNDTVYGNIKQFTQQFDNIESATTDEKDDSNINDLINKEENNSMIIAKDNDIVVSDVKNSGGSNTMGKGADNVLDAIKNGMKDVVNTEIEINANTIGEKIKADEIIDVRSMVRGGFNWICKKSGIAYRWSGIGAVEQLPYEDLYQMYTKNRRYLTDPCLIVEDERIIEKFRLMKTYENVASVYDLKHALQDSNEMRRVCEVAKTVNMKHLLTERLIQLYNDGTFNNYNVITTAEKVLDTQIIKRDE